MVGAGNYPGNSTCTLIATANPAWNFQSWTENGAQVSASASYAFTVQSNRSLVAVFVQLPPSLNASLTSPGSLKLTWPTNQPGYTLQENVDAGTTNWTATSAAVTVSGTNNLAIVPTSGIKKFFRLKSP